LLGRVLQGSRGGYGHTYRKTGGIAARIIAQDPDEPR
jgi:hypothetical protein